jgi:hypothetical protein
VGVLVGFVMGGGRGGVVRVDVVYAYVVVLD